MANSFKELKKAVDSNNLVIFCGSGTSKDLGLPSWSGLLKFVIQRLSTDKPQYLPFIKLLDDGLIDPLLVLDLLQSEHRDTILSVLEQRLQVNKAHSFQLHRKILKLSKQVITTNYDKAFEYACENPNVILNNGKYKIARIMDSKQFIFKIHGDIDSPQDCILFTNQYKALYDKESAFYLGLNMLFINRTVLFIGFSMDDPYIAKLINTLTTTFDKFNRKHFIITTDSRFNESKFKGKINAYILKDYADLNIFLEHLISYRKEKKNLAPNHNIRYPLYPLSLWNLEHIQGVMDTLSSSRNITVIQGPPGSGKTSLANAFANHSLGISDPSFEYNFDYVVWFSIGSAPDRTKLLSNLLDEIGRVTGYVRIIYFPSSQLELKRSEVDTILNENSVLIILDGFHLSKDKALEDWLKDITGLSRVLLTSSSPVAFEHSLYKLPEIDERTLRRILDQECEARGISFWPDNRSDKMLHFISEITCGNPEAIIIVLGIMRNFPTFFKSSFKVNKALDTAFNTLYQIILDRLSPDARKLLTYFPLVAEKNQLEREALLSFSELNLDTFNLALDELANWNILRYDVEEKFCKIPSSFIDYLKKLSITEETKTAIKIKFIDYYCKLTVEHTKRKYPDQEYWNSLVSSKMDGLDDKKSSIFKAIEWAGKTVGQEEKLLTFANYIVHYLDSRLYNQQRIELVEKAISICRKLKKDYLAALFKIDALGWTLVEEGDLIRAQENITTGLRIADTLHENDPHRKDLIALGQAWLARVRVEQENWDEAESLVQQALTYHGEPWIQYRVYMAAGDVFFKMNKLNETLRQYQLAKFEIKNYDGEGSNYQINPRLGLAYLRIGNNRYLNEAEKIFNLLQNNDHILIGKLYGEFGLAMVKYMRGHVEHVKELVCSVELEISKRSPNNLLLKLIRKYKSEIFDDCIDPIA